MKKKEMEKRIRSLEEKLRRAERRRDLDVKVIQNMAQRLNLDLEELLHDSRKPGRVYRQTISYKDSQFTCCPFCKKVIYKDDKYCQYCGKPNELYQGAEKRVETKTIEERLRQLERSMELAVSLLSVLVDHIDMKRHAKILTREEILKRGGIDVILQEQAWEINEINECMEQEKIDYRQAVFRHSYKKKQDECRKNIKELETTWMLDHKN